MQYDNMVEIVTQSGMRVRANYVPHKRVEFSLFGFTIKVCKPYGRPVSKSYVCYNSLPMVEMSTNSTCVVDPHALVVIAEVINAACVQILNMENDGNNIPIPFSSRDNNGNVPYSYDLPKNIEHIHNIGKVPKRKSIPYAEITSQAIYEDKSGNQWIYVGEVSVMESNDGNRYHEKRREGSHLCYIDYSLIRGIKELVNITTNGDIVVPQYRGCVDLYKTKKSFVKKICDLHWNGFCIVDGSTTYKFYRRNMQ